MDMQTVHMIEGEVFVVSETARSERDGAWKECFEGTVAGGTAGATADGGAAVLGTRYEKIWRRSSSWRAEREGGCLSEEN